MPTDLYVVSQIGIEVLLVAGSSKNVRTSQTVLEVLRDSEEVPASNRITNHLAEILEDVNSTTNISKVGLETLYDTLYPINVSTVGLEVLRDADSHGTPPTGVPPGYMRFTLDQEVELTEDDIFVYMDMDGNVITTGAFNGADLNQVLVPNINHPIDRGATWALIRPDLDGQLYRVLTVSENEDDYSVIALQHDESKYAIIDAVPLFDDLPTSVLDSDAVPPPTNLNVAQWYEDIIGQQSEPHITVSWSKPVSDTARIQSYELQLHTPVVDYYTVQNNAYLSWDSERLTSSNAADYSVRVRAIDITGRFSSWVYATGLNVDGKTTEPNPPTDVVVESLINGFQISWVNDTATDFSHTEVWLSSTTLLADAVLVNETPASHYTVDNLLAGQTRYVWLRTVTFADTNNKSTFGGPYAGTSRSITAPDIDASLTKRIVEIVVTDPTIAMSTGDGKAYFPVPSEFNGYELTHVVSRVIVAGTTGGTTIQLAKQPLGSTYSDMLSTPMTIDSTEVTTTTAAIPAVIDATYKIVSTDDLIRIDIDSVDSGSQGLIVTLTFTPH